MKFLVTGVAGFIGMHCAKRLLERGDSVIGIDNLNEYYDPNLKIGRLNILSEFINFTFIKADIADRSIIEQIFVKERFDGVIHLAAQAGVRYSIENPYPYVESNLSGFLNILEGCRTTKVSHLVYASSSSVYGGNTKMPFSEVDKIDHPLSLYAATKRANELMAHSYSHLYNLSITGLRFFTVYGPWGRPDQALFLFVKSILAHEPIKIFNGGEMYRDFTYIDDVVESVMRILDKPPTANSTFDYQNPSPESSWAPFKIFNVGNSDSVLLMDFVEAVEDALKIRAKKIYLPLQSGDVLGTYADTSLLNECVGFQPKTTIEIGVKNFVKWYKDFYI